MESYEVLKDAMDGPGAKAVASKLGVSSSLVYKWCEKPPAQPSPRRFGASAAEVADDQSGARNPLDRIVEIVHATGDGRIVSWICARAGGFFVPNPEKAERGKMDLSVIGAMQGLFKEFSDVLDEVSRAIADGSGIDSSEAKRIRREWEELKAKAEGFVCASEKGFFDK